MRARAQKKNYFNTGSPSCQFQDLQIQRNVQVDLRALRYREDPLYGTQDNDGDDGAGVSTQPGYLPVPSMAISDESLEVYHSTWAKKWQRLGEVFGKKKSDEGEQQGQGENSGTVNETRM